jgi:survival of motor neuron-related-splicing factor 30
MIKMLDESLADLNPRPAPQTQQRKPSPPPAAEENPPKWSRENHPAFKKAAPPAPPPEEEAPVVYQVNDNIMAKWLSGDKGFYPARITSVTGSSTAPIYTVKFKSYDTVETLRSKDIRPVASAKRKADGTVVGPGPAAPVGGGEAGSGIVMSAGAELYPHAQEKKEKESKLDDKGRPKYKKIKATKELEAGKNKWQEFNAKGKAGKGVKKESMFRTPEGAKGRGKFSCSRWAEVLGRGLTRDSGLHRLWPGHAEGSYEKSSCVSTY